MRSTYLKDRGLIATDVDLDGTNRWRGPSRRRLKVQLQRFLQVLDRLVFAAALARHVDIEALGNNPFAFPPNAR